MTHNKEVNTKNTKKNQSLEQYIYASLLRNQAAAPVPLSFLAMVAMYFPW